MQTIADEHKRVNFFKGFFASEIDFNALVEYSREKQRLHNRYFHQPGVVRHVGGELKVTSRGKGDFSIEVAPGYATDGVGNDLVLTETKVVTVDIAKFKLPQVVYLALKYYDDPTDFIVNKANPQYKGHTRIAEKVKIEVLAAEPSLDTGVELARVRLEEGVEDVTNAKNPFRPEAGELDLRFVPVAGQSGSFLAPDTHARLTQLFSEMRLNFFALSRQFPSCMTSAHVAQGALTAGVLETMNQLDYRTAFRLLQFLIELQKEVSGEVRQTPALQGQALAVQEFDDNLKALLNLSLQTDVTPEDLNNVIIYQGKAAAAIRKMLAEKPVRKEVIPGEEEKPEVKVVGVAMSLDEIKVHSKEFPQDITVDGVVYHLVDSLDVVNAESEKAHGFQIGGAKDEWRSRQEFMFPDGVKVGDTGRAHVDGFAQFTINGLKPSKDVLVIRRIDYVLGGLKTEMQVDGKPVGTWEIAGNDKKFRWRNMPWMLPGSAVAGDKVTVKQVALSADRDVNMFRYWFYQAV
jgi:hypothetical protein